MSEISEKDTVKLRSGGPMMTVERTYVSEETHKESAWCVWFEKGKKQMPLRGEFLISSLIKVDPQRPIGAVG